ncbi:MAG: ThiF family adenylyltransferase [Candidatus Aenigmarchaeota archaeon]|nr:ThiF family adenylyltransferase [Candidatus Aenigmarchaeota archaeon]
MKRFQRQTKLLGIKSMKKLSKTKLAIVGVGSIGSILAEILARSGFTKIKIIDRDFVEENNIDNQNFRQSDIGLAKVEAVESRLKEINSKIEISKFATDLNYINIDKILSDSDIIIDATDNIETRMLLNEFCVKNRKPWFYTAVIKSNGFAFGIIPDHACLKCFMKIPENLETCELHGLLMPIAYFLSSKQATNIINYVLYGKRPGFFIADISKSKFFEYIVKKNRKCECCVKKRFEYLTGKKNSQITRICSNTFQINTNRKINFSKFKFKTKSKFLIHINKGKLNITLFKDGRVIVNGAKNEKDALKIALNFVG